MRGELKTAGGPTAFCSGSNLPAYGCVSKMNGIIAQKRPGTAEPDRRLAWTDESSCWNTAISDRPAFEELVRRYEKELYGYLRHYLGDADMAEAVFQQTFFKST